MIKNYLKIAFRYLWQNKTFAFINIFGLAFGLCCCLLMILFIQNELNYDRFNKNANTVYRVAFSDYLNQGGFATTPLPIAPALKDQMPEVKAITRITYQDPYLIKYGTTEHFEPIAFADQDLFKIFSMPLLMGDPATALKEPNSVVISEQMAKKYFGNDSPMNKILKIGSAGTLYSTVKGVFKTLPQNSQFQFNCLVSYTTMYKAGFTTNLWQQMPGNYTYALFNNAGDAKKLEAKLPSFVKYNLGNTIDKNTTYNLTLQPLTEIHLKSHLQGELPGEGNITYIYLFAAIAFIILLIACFNFLNFATANAVKRIKEIGVRKVIGANRTQLVKQFLTESLLTYLLATILSLLFVQLALPFFNYISGKSFLLADIMQPEIVVGLILIGIIAGLVTGLFPALSISRLSSYDALKGKMTGGSKITLRKVLVTTQFAASLTLMVCAAVVYQQMQFVRQQVTTSRGEQVIVFPVNSKLVKAYDALKNELLANTHIVKVTATTNAPGFSGDSWPMRLTENSPAIQTENFVADDDFLSTLNIPLVAGRLLSKNNIADVKAGFVVNETAVQALGFKTANNAIGKQVWWGGGKSRKQGTIQGVVKDFHFRSLHEKIAPVLIQFSPFDWMTYNYMLIKVKPGNFNASINFIRKTTAGFDASWLVDYKFFNENFESLHQKDEQQGRIFAAFTFVAILISCLGLFGLTIYATQQRLKEIGIRKVLGASVASIVNLLSTGFVKLILIAACVAFPVAWWVMNKWLGNFVYHIHIQWGVFAIAGISVILIALATISSQAVKAALSNPVKSLKSE